MKLSAKDQRIIDAVNRSRCEPGNHYMDGHVISECVKTALYDKGDIVFANKRANKAYYREICTVEEYEQCTEDMARAEWMNGPWFYELYLHHYTQAGIDISDKRLKPVREQQFVTGQDITIEGFEERDWNFQYYMDNGVDSYVTDGVCYMTIPTSRIQPLEQIKPEVIGYDFVTIGGVRVRFSVSEITGEYAEFMTGLSSIKHTNGKPTFRPVYKGNHND